MRPLQGNRTQGPYPVHCRHAKRSTEAATFPPQAVGAVPLSGDGAAPMAVDGQTDGRAPPRKLYVGTAALGHRRDDMQVRCLPLPCRSPFSFASCYPVERMRPHPWLNTPISSPEPRCLQTQDCTWLSLSLTPSLTKAALIFHVLHHVFAGRPGDAAGPVQRHGAHRGSVGAHLHVRRNLVPCIRDSI